jgi:hypothetical protein
MDQILQAIPNLLGLDPASFTLLLIVVATVANIASKLIPESATGALGVVRKICAFLGVALANRITPNVNSTDIGKAVAAGIPDEKVKEAAAALPEAVKTGHGSAAFAEAVVDVGVGDALGTVAANRRFEELNRPGG